MCKRNRYLPPPLKGDGRLVNSFVRSHYKRPNALRHGVYSEAPLIPGEDPGEFDQQYAELLDEWKPSGPTLRFALRGLADWMWRMGRLKKSTQTQLSWTTFDPQSPSFNEAWGLGMFMGYLRSEPETCFEQRARKYLLPDKIDHLKQKFPRSDYQSTSEWAKAVTAEIILVLYPGKDGRNALENAELVIEGADEWKTEQNVAGCMIYAREILEYDFKETERLEARIIRQIRVCTELKAREEVEKAKEEAEKAKKKMRSKT